MPFKGLFIGIDRYASVGIDWLSCARRDAAALNGLFTDTMGGETVLLNDGQATRVAIQDEFRRLETAATDDVVVVAFSGHGSETHELVAYDTDPYDISGTSIPLTTLGEWCARIPCRRLLIVLDCCFSGGMGAKALQVDARARSLESVDAELNRISGEGRVVLTGVPKPPLERSCFRRSDVVRAKGRRCRDRRRTSSNGRFTRKTTANVYMQPIPASVMAALNSRTRAVMAQPLDCISAYLAFNMTPSTLDAFNPPTTLQVYGSGISAAYGMPKIQFYDNNGNLLAQFAATSVAGNGSSLSASMPNVSTFHTATFGVRVMNVQQDGSLQPAGVLPLDVNGNEPRVLVSISGNERCIHYQPYYNQWVWIPDSGTVSVTVNGKTSSTSYNGGCDQNGNVT